MPQKYRNKIWYACILSVKHLKWLFGQGVSYSLSCMGLLDITLRCEQLASDGNLATSAFKSLHCRLYLLSVERSSYTGRALGTLASLCMELAEAVFSKFTEFVQLVYNGFSFRLAILTNERRWTIAFREWCQQKLTKASRKVSLLCFTILLWRPMNKIHTHLFVDMLGTPAVQQIIQYTLLWLLSWYSIYQLQFCHCHLQSMRLRAQHLRQHWALSSEKECFYLLTYSNLLYLSVTFRNAHRLYPGSFTLIG